MEIFNNLLRTPANSSVSGLGIESVLALVPTITKIVVLLLSLFYLSFTFLLTRRVKIMNTNFKTPYAPAFSLLAFLNFAASLIVSTITLLTLIK